MEDAPPHKRQRREDIPCFYYHLLGIVLPLFCIEPGRDLEVFQDAFVPDHADPDTIGQTEENPYHIPASIAKLLLAAANPVMKIAEIAAALKTVTNACRDPELLAILYDLGASMNSKAAVSWTARYNATVDSMCTDSEPPTNILPVPEIIVEIAKLIHEGAKTLAPYFPETYKAHPKTHDYCALDIMTEAYSATGARRHFLNRVLGLKGLGEIPSTILCICTSPKSTKYLKVYWQWRSSVVREENRFETQSITDTVAYRYAVRYETTRKLFLPITYNKSSKYIFAGDYPEELQRWTYKMVDPKTGEFVDLATTPEVWTPELVKCIVTCGSRSIPTPIIQLALRTLESASVATFTGHPFKQHSLCIHLLNRNPSGADADTTTMKFDIFKGLTSKDLHWANLDKLAPRIYSSDYLSLTVSRQVIPSALRDRTRKEICFHPKIRRLFNHNMYNSNYDYEVRIVLCQYGDDAMPLGSLFNRSIRTHNGTGKYTVNQGNMNQWKILEKYRCAHLFGKEAEKMLVKYTKMQR